MNKLFLLLTCFLLLMPGNVWALGCDANTVLLSHFDGSDAATTTTDEDCDANGAHDMTDFQGTAQLDTVQKKFGTASVLFDGNSDYINIPDHNDFTMLSGDFTIDFWIRFNAVNQYTGIVGQGTSGEKWSLWFHYGVPYLDLFAHNGSAYTADYHCPWSPSTNTWYHVAVERDGSDCNMFIDGVGQVVTTATAWGTIGNSTNDFTIGIANGYYTNGWVEEMRLSKGIARYEGVNFTPPTEAYAPAVTPSGQVIMNFVKYIKRGNGSGYDRIVERHWYTHKDIKWPG